MPRSERKEAKSELGGVSQATCLCHPTLSRSLSSLGCGLVGACEGTISRVSLRLVQLISSGRYQGVCSKGQSGQTGSWDPFFGLPTEKRLSAQWPSGKFWLTVRPRGWKRKEMDVKLGRPPQLLHKSASGQVLEQ